MRIPAVVILCVLDPPSPGRPDCYGLHEPNALEQRRAYARDMLLSCEQRGRAGAGFMKLRAVAVERLPVRPTRRSWRAGGGGPGKQDRRQ
jgi:hypothetical protein